MNLQNTQTFALQVRAGGQLLPKESGPHPGNKRKYFCSTEKACFNNCVPAEMPRSPVP